jgi:hypothetical protein
MPVQQAAKHRLLSLRKKGCCSKRFRTTIRLANKSFGAFKTNMASSDACVHPFHRD